MVSRAESGEGRKSDWEGVGLRGGSVEVAARRRPGCASQAISHFKEGGLPGGGFTQVEFSERNRAPKWGSSSTSPFPAGLASAILGTAARPAQLPALLISFCFLPISFRKLIYKSVGWLKVRGRDEGGEGSEQEKAGHLGGGRIWAVGRAPDGNGARWAWPPTAASLPPQSRLGYLGRRDCE